MCPVMSTTDNAEDAARHPWGRAVRRTGWFAKGLVYVLIAYLCAEIGFGQMRGGTQEASARGAFDFVSMRPYGTPLLLVVAVGLFAYAADRILVATIFPDPDHSWMRRTATLSNGILWAGFGVLAVVTATPIDDGGGGGGGSNPRGVTAAVMAWPFGPWLVAAVGIALLAFAVSEVRHALKRDGTEEKRSGLSKSARRAVAALEAAGIAGHGLAFALVGYFLIQAAVKHDPKQAESLDGALARFAGEPFGSVAIAVTALGLLAYGVHCFIQGRMRRLAS